MSDARAAFGRRPMLSFTKLCVADLARSVDFYTRVLGMKQTAHYEFPDLHEVILKFTESLDEASLALMKWIPDREVVVGHEHGRLGIVTPDLDGLVERVRGAGFEVTEESRDLSEQGIRVVFVADPDGYAIEIVEMLQR